MLLPFSESLVVTTPFDPEMSMLADRHYSRRTVGSRQFLNNGRKIVIRNAEGTILFGWMWPQEEMRMDGQRGYNCAIFRNESERKSSEVILECERIAFDRWGFNRLYTYVDPQKTKAIKCRGERVVGFCFIKAGWKFIRESKSGLHLLAKDPLT
jgi:hypothetical protein